jgi:hypothetical protein
VCQRCSLITDLRAAPTTVELFDRDGKQRSDRLRLNRLRTFKRFSTNGFIRRAFWGRLQTPGGLTAGRSSRVLCRSRLQHPRQIHPFLPSGQSQTHRFTSLSVESNILRAYNHQKRLSMNGMKYIFPFIPSINVEFIIQNIFKL